MTDFDSPVDRVLVSTESYANIEVFDLDDDVASPTKPLNAFGAGNYGSIGFSGLKSALNNAGDSFSWGAARRRSSKRGSIAPHQRHILQRRGTISPEAFSMDEFYGDLAGQEEREKEQRRKKNEERIEKANRAHTEKERDKAKQRAAASAFASNNHTGSQLNLLSGIECDGIEDMLLDDDNPVTFNQEFLGTLVEKAFSGMGDIVDEEDVEIDDDSTLAGRDKKRGEVLDSSEFAQSSDLPAGSGVKAAQQHRQKVDSDNSGPNGGPSTSDADIQEEFCYVSDGSDLQQQRVPQKPALPSPSKKGGHGSWMATGNAGPNGTNSSKLVGKGVHIKTTPATRTLSPHPPSLGPPEGHRKQNPPPAREETGEYVMDDADTLSPDYSDSDVSLDEEIDEGSLAATGGTKMKSIDNPSSSSYSGNFRTNSKQDTAEFVEEEDFSEDDEEFGFCDSSPGFPSSSNMSRK